MTGLVQTVPAQTEPAGVRVKQERVEPEEEEVDEDAAAIAAAIAESMVVRPKEVVPLPPRPATEPTSTIDASQITDTNQPPIDPSVQQSDNKATELFCYQCLICGKSYRSKNHLETHVWRHANAVSATPFRGPGRFKHGRTWAKTTVFQCGLCGEGDLKGESL